MAAPIVYKSTDTSAPTMTGVVGSMITLLDACLVNGYGSKAAAGWTKPYSGTNSAQYYQGSGGGTQRYVQVNDNSDGTGGAKEAIVSGYETSTGMVAGNNSGNSPLAFPTFAQSPGGIPGLAWRKSNTADSTTRAWLVIADAYTFYVFIQSGDSTTTYTSMGFGDIYSHVSSDAYKAGCWGKATLNTAAVAGFLDQGNESIVSLNTAGHYLARGPAGTGSSIQTCRIGLGTTLFTGPIAGTDAAGSYMNINRLYVGGSTNIRGYLRGIYQCINGGTGVSDGDTFSGTGEFLGRSFQVLKTVQGGAAIALETTAWDIST